MSAVGSDVSVPGNTVNFAGASIVSEIFILQKASNFVPVLIMGSVRDRFV